MHQLKDNQNRDWTVGPLTLLDVRRVKNETKDKWTLTEAEDVGELIGDDLALYEVCWVLLQDQAQQHKLDEVAFAKVFTECYEKFVGALVDALKDFSQCLGKSEITVSIERISVELTKKRSAVVKNLSSAKYDQAMEAEINRMDKEMDEKLSKIIQGEGLETPPATDQST